MFWFESHLIWFRQNIWGEVDLQAAPKSANDIHLDPIELRNSASEYSWAQMRKLIWMPTGKGLQDTETIFEDKEDVREVVL